MSDIIGRLLDEAEKAQRKGHLVLAEVCRDASDQLGLVMEERNRLQGALQHVTLWVEKYANPQTILPYNTKAARAALGETGHD
jgi:hypothetical protein